MLKLILFIFFLFFIRNLIKSIFYSNNKKFNNKKSSKINSLNIIDADYEEIK